MSCLIACLYQSAALGVSAFFVSASRQLVGCSRCMCLCVRPGDVAESNWGSVWDHSHNKNLDRCFMHVQLLIRCQSLHLCRYHASAFSYITACTHMTNANSPLHRVYVFKPGCSLSIDRIQSLGRTLLCTFSIYTQLF